MPDDAILVERLSLGGNGLSVVIKDSIDIHGYRTCRGTKSLRASGPAVHHAHVVERLLAGGCRIVGKANMHELAFGATGINLWTGTPINPHYPNHMPGGSSSGSAAAVAAGLANFAIGTDTGGSIRIPAACCGVVGLKTTYGRILRKGAYPAVSSLDCIGPIAREMHVIEIAMELMDPRFRRCRAPASITLGLVGVDADRDIRDAVSSALAWVGVEVRPVALPRFREAFFACALISAAENFQDFGHLIDRPDIGDDVRERLAVASRITLEQVARARAVSVAFRADVDRALDAVDALALPTLPTAVPTLDDAYAVNTSRLTDLVRPFNLSGHPAITLPLRNDSQPPAGLQLVGSIDGDAELCAVGRRIEATLRDDAGQIDGNARSDDASLA